MDAAQKQLLYLFAGAEDFDGSVSELTVTRIDLVRGVLQKKDKWGMGISVPLWQFTFQEINQGNGIEEPWQLFINALDGSYVNPRVTMESLMETYE